MDPHSTNLTARSSHSQSPSHSASASASASATSSLHKRKLAATAAASDDHVPPPSSFHPSSLSADTREGALTSNDDVESISAGGAGSDSDADDSDADAVVDDDDDEFDNDSSMRNFTAARLEANNATGSTDVTGSLSTRNTKIKTESSTVKIEPSDGTKDGGPTGTGVLGPAVTAGSTVTGMMVKEDPTKIFTDNLQTSGAYSAREEILKREVNCLMWC